MFVNYTIVVAKLFKLRYADVFVNNRALINRNVGINCNKFLLLQECRMCCTDALCNNQTLTGVSSATSLWQFGYVIITLYCVYWCVMGL